MGTDELNLLGRDDIVYQLDLTAPQLKMTWTALHILFDGLGHEERDVKEVVRQVLDKLPGEHDVRSIAI